LAIYFEEIACVSALRAESEALESDDATAEKTGREAGPVIRGVEDARSSSSTTTTPPPHSPHPSPAPLPHSQTFQTPRIVAPEAHTGKHITEADAKMATTTAIEPDEEAGFGCVNAPRSLLYY
ncbi:uncharacterized protein SCHCODRAFT_02517554, partial [Schizophyllum commune H4-8]|uniref:uncharacterized protein n=1 Tax=Schizophyllum commune (strain H4-8 / FGSC 9210) TaxID=578458 RepID=UPI00215DE399